MTMCILITMVLSAAALAPQRAVLTSAAGVGMCVCIFSRAETGIVCRKERGTHRDHFLVSRKPPVGALTFLSLVSRTQEKHQDARECSGVGAPSETTSRPAEEARGGLLKSTVLPFRTGCVFSLSPLSNSTLPPRHKYAGPRAGGGH